MPYLFAIVLLVAPLYVWRFSIALGSSSLPTNFLMLVNFAVIALGLIVIAKRGYSTELKKIKSSLMELGKPMLVGITLVGIASLISLFAFGINVEKIAQWVVLYAQPLALFVLARYFSSEDRRVLKYFRVAAYSIVAAAGALAVIQYTTLYTLPQDWWGNANEPKRAIAFFAHANAFGLFITPLLAWLIPDAVKRLQNAWQDFKTGPTAIAIVKDFWINIFAVLAWLVGGVGILLSLSRGAWLGLIVAAGIYVLLSANKKMIIAFAVAGVLLASIVVATPNLRYRVLLPFKGEKSAVARFSLWNTGWQEISDNPILGKGINGFSDSWETYNTDTNLEHYNFPHNIVLNFWIDLGLLGLIGMGIVFCTVIWEGIKGRKNVLALGALLFVIAIAVHGLIDIPYLKNDLAIVFWLIIALSFKAVNKKTAQ